MNSLRLGINSLGVASTGGLTKAALIARLKAVEIGALACYLPSEYATTAWKQYDASGDRAAVGYGVGFLGDILQGMELGPELVVNGDFSNGLTGWTANLSSLSVVNGKLRITNTTSGGAGYAYQSVGPALAGEFFVINSQSFDATGVSSAFIANTYAANRKAFAIIRVTASTTLYYNRINAGAIGSYSDSDNASMRRISGCHLTGPTESSRPTLRYAGGIYYLDPTSGQGLTAYLPASVGGTVTVVYAQPGVGAVVVPGVAVNSQAVLLPYPHSGLVIMPSTASVEAVAAVAAMVDVLARRVV